MAQPNVNRRVFDFTKTAVSPQVKVPLPLKVGSVTRSPQAKAPLVFGKGCKTCR